MRQFYVKVNGEEFQVEIEELAGGRTATPVAKPQTVAAPVVAAAPKAKPAAALSGSLHVTAPMPGTVLAVKVKVGDQVKAGDVIVILEAMKLENNLIANGTGTVKAIQAQAGSSVNAGDLLVEIV